MDVNQAIINNREVLTVIALHSYTPENSHINILELKKAYKELNPREPIQGGCSACTINAMIWLYNYAQRENLFSDEPIGKTIIITEPKENYQDIVKAVKEKFKYKKHK